MTEEFSASNPNVEVRPELDDSMCTPENLSPQYLEINLETDDWTEKLRTAPIYRKNVQVQAVQVANETPVTTILADGTEETKNIAYPGDWIVTNPNGEKYAITASKFEHLYRATEDPDVFKAKGMARALPNPYGKHIQINVPWGQPQLGNESCYIATTYEPEKPDVVNSGRYLIGGDEFISTYVIAE